MVTTVEIDPRIEARRDAVRRETGRRRLRVLVAIAVVVSTLVGAYLLVESPFLAVDHVNVTGTVHANPAAVQAAIAGEHGRPVLRVNLGAAAARIEQLPWVEHASVTRSLPGTLHVSITEAKPVAYVKVHGVVAVIGPNDRVIARVSSPPPGAVEVVGARVAPPLHALLSPAGTGRLAAAVPPSIRSRLRAIALRPNTIALLLNVGEIRLGTVASIGPKLAAAAAVLAHYNGAPFQYIDVTDYTDPVSFP
jgi:cell division protein FtsQ